MNDHSRSDTGSATVGMQPCPDLERSMIRNQEVATLLDNLAELLEAKLLVAVRDWLAATVLVAAVVTPVDVVPVYRPGIARGHRRQPVDSALRLRQRCASTLEVCEVLPLAWSSWAIQAASTTRKRAPLSSLRGCRLQSSRKLRFASIG
jgi:hypothetical protein